MGKSCFKSHSNSCPIEWHTHTHTQLPVPMVMPVPMRVLALLLALLSGPASVRVCAARAPVECRSTLDDSFFNRCRMDAPPTALTALAQAVGTWLAPQLIAVAGTAVLLLLPLLLLSAHLHPDRDAESDAESDGVRSRDHDANHAVSRHRTLTGDGVNVDSSDQPFTRVSDGVSSGEGRRWRSPSFKFVCVRAYLRSHLLALNFLRRASYTLALSVALYAVFRQHRPCTCSDDGLNFAPNGCKY